MGSWMVGIGVTEFTGAGLVLFWKSFCAAHLYWQKHSGVMGCVVSCSGSDKFTDLSSHGIVFVPGARPASLR